MRRIRSTAGSIRPRTSFGLRAILRSGPSFAGGSEPQPNDDRCNGLGATTTPVARFPAGRSPFGIYDLCGNTWEWTESERADGVTRFAILRGGSFYQARKGNGSWYMDGGPQEVSFGCKCLLAWPGLDRCATVGFRCAADLEP